MISQGYISALTDQQLYDLLEMIEKEFDNRFDKDTLV
jgi:hypothetical protein